jgi:hypothetical protein
MLKTVPAGVVGPEIYMANADMPGPLEPALAAFADAAAALLGVQEAHADAPPPFPYNWVESGCWIANPNQVNHFDLFDAIPNAEWRGCVEARPAPFDVTDEPPRRANADTLFVPYFWPDGVDWGQARDNYIDDNQDEFPGTNYRHNGWGRALSVYKYDDEASIDEVGPDTSGPNRSCPTPIVPLTDREGDLVSAVRGLSHWLGSGTISSEGFAWGWRVLSPGAPFTQGAPYDDSNKILVLMTDGLNWAAENPSDLLRSDYTAYNHLGLWRHWNPGGGPRARNHEQFADYFDDRLAEVCENAKDAGVEVYTVVFREPDRRTRTLLRSCATDDEHAFTADSEQELTSVFAAIAQSIAALRLTR